MSKMVPKSARREAMAAGAAEVKAKFKSDLSRWTRARRLISLKPVMGCIECDATGKVTCATCDGTGQVRIVFEDKQQACTTCEGTGRVTCVDCVGRGYVPNVHRKKILWVLVIGVLAWAFVLYQLWNRDVLPEYRAHGGGAKLNRSGGASVRQPSGNAGVGAPSTGNGTAMPGGGR